MKLQEKIREFIRESDDIIEPEGLNDTNLSRENSYIMGCEYGWECVLRLLEDFKINPELDK